jgi:hypothetical protein
MDIKDLKGLVEAYQSVYVEEDVEQLDEQGGRLPGPARRAAQQAARERQNVQRAQAPTLPTGRQRGASFKYQAVAADKGRGGDAAYRAGGGDAAAKSGLTRQQIQQKGMAATKAAAAKPAPTPAAKPSPKPAPTPAAKPAAPAAAKPAAKPAATGGTKPAAVGSAAKVEPAKPAAEPKIKKDVADIKSMQSASQERQKASTPQLSARAQALKAGGPKGGARERMLNQSFDMFDVVLGHLLDEGYAETEQAALAIMANMSEDWKDSIVEAVKGESSERRKGLAAERKAGNRPLSAKEGEKYASHKLAQIAYAKRRKD